MAVYQLLQNQATVVPAPIIGVIPQSVLGGPLQNQAFQFTVAGNPGVSVSATFQLWGSNDPNAMSTPQTANWVGYGAAVTVSGVGTANGGATGTACWNAFGVTMSAISGAGAKASVNMSG